MAPLFFCLQGLPGRSMFRDNPANRAVTIQGHLLFAHSGVQVTQEIPSPGIFRLLLYNLPEFTLCRALFTTLPVKFAGEYIGHKTIPQQLFLPLESQGIVRGNAAQALQNTAGISPRPADRVDCRLMVLLKNIPIDVTVSDSLFKHPCPGKIGQGGHIAVVRTDALDKFYCIARIILRLSGNIADQVDREIDADLPDQPGGMFDLSRCYRLAETRKDRRGTGFNAELDTLATGPLHPDQQLLIECTDPGLTVPQDPDTEIYQQPAKIYSPGAVSGKGVIP